MRSGRAAVLLLAIALLFSAVASPVGVRADDDLVVQKFDLTSRWPGGASVSFAATAPSDIVSVAANVTSGKGKASVVRRPTFTPGQDVSGTFDVPSVGAPPFGEIAVQLTFQESSGRQTKTDWKRVRYIDARYQWTSQTEGLVTVNWHGEVGSQALAILKTANKTIEEVSVKAGTRLDRPIQLVIYNSKPEMDSVIGFQSATTQAQLVVEGQAQIEHDLVLVMAGADSLITTAHELTHLITMTAAENPYLDLPFWLNEGLSVYFQGNGGPEYLSYYQNAVAQNRLLSVRSLTSRPGKPEEALLMYGEGYQLIKYLIDKYGPAKLSQYLAAYKTGTDHDSVMKSVYGFDRDGLNAEWRASIGLPAQVNANDAPPETVQPVESPAAGVNQRLVLIGASVGGVFVLGLFSLGLLAFVLHRRRSWE